MTDRTDDFFIPDNDIRLPEDLDYSRVEEYIRSAEAFSRSSENSLIHARIHIDKDRQPRQ